MARYVEFETLERNNLDIELYIIHVVSQFRYHHEQDPDKICLSIRHGDKILDTITY